MKLLILILYGTILVAIGIYSAFRVRTPADYFIAGKQSGVWRVAGSLLATILGGSAILGSTNLAMTRGWAALWYLLSASLGLWILVPLVRKVSRYGKFTLAGLLGHFYGETARKSASVIIPLAWTGIVAAQIVAAAKVLYAIFLFPYEYGVLVSGVAFIAYTLLGGQMSILKTDLYQSVIILAGVAACALAIARMPGIHVQPIPRSFPFNPAFGPADLLILLLTFSSTFVVGPDIYSRVFCARDEDTARKSVMLVAAVLIPFAFALTYLGMAASANLPAEKLQGSVALIELIGFYLPEWAVGIMAAALLSAVLSSADTTLLSAAILLSELIKKDIDNKKSLRITRALITVTGLASILIAMKITSIIGMLLMALAVYSGAFIVPLIAALTNMKVNRRMAVAAMITGGTIALTGKLLTDIYGFAWGNWIIAAAFPFNFLLLKFKYKTRIKN